ALHDSLPISRPPTRTRADPRSQRPDHSVGALVHSAFNSTADLVQFGERYSSESLSSNKNESESLFGPRRLDAQTPAAPNRSGLVATAVSASQSASVTLPAAAAEAKPETKAMTVAAEQ